MVQVCVQPRDRARVTGIWASGLPPPPFGQFRVGVSSGGRRPQAELRIAAAGK
jgi:hypothetical protein